MVLSDDIATKCEAVVERKRKIDELKTRMSDMQKEREEHEKMLVEEKDSLDAALGVTVIASTSPAAPAAASPPAAVASASTSGEVATKKRRVSKEQRMLQPTENYANASANIMGPEGAAGRTRVCTDHYTPVDPTR